MLCNGSVICLQHRDRLFQSLFFQVFFLHQPEKKCWSALLSLKRLNCYWCVDHLRAGPWRVNQTKMEVNL